MFKLPVWTTRFIFCSPPPPPLINTCSFHLIKYTVCVYSLVYCSLSCKCFVGLLIAVSGIFPGGNAHPCQEKEGRAQQHSGCNEKGCCQEGVTCIIRQINLYLQISRCTCVFLTSSIIAGRFWSFHGWRLTVVGSFSNGVYQILLIG